MPVSRRELLVGGAGCAAGALAGWSWPRLAPGTPSSLVSAMPVTGAGPHEPGVAADEALQQLLAGNRRFADGHATHPHASTDRRAALSQGQQPFAAVLGCSDSRVPPEIVFDAGLGDLFVVREAGHVADDDTLGSIEYAVEHLGVRLIAVVGHQNCGAVRAAVAAVSRDEPVPGHILRLVDDITPAVLEVKNQGGDVLDNAVRANVRLAVRQLQQSIPLLRPLVRRQELHVVGLYYPLASGLVELVQ